MLLHFSRKADTAGPLKETLSPGTQRKLKSSDGLLMADLALEPERLNYKSWGKTRVSLHRFPPELDEKQLGTGDRQPLERLTVTSDACLSPSYSQCLVPDSTQLSLFPESLSRRFNLLLPLKHIPPTPTPRAWAWFEDFALVWLPGITLLSRFVDPLPATVCLESSNLA